MDRLDAGRSFESKTFVATDECEYKTRNHQSKNSEASRLLLRCHSREELPFEWLRRLESSLINGRQGDRCNGTSADFIVPGKITIALADNYWQALSKGQGKSNLDFLDCRGLVWTRLQRNSIIGDDV